MSALPKLICVLTLLLLASTANAVDAGTLLVLNKSDNTVSLVDLASRKVVATVPTGVGPHEVAVSPDGKIAVVANYGAQTPGNSLTVINILSKQVVKTIDLGEYRRPQGIVWLKGNEIEITSEANKALLVVDENSGTFSADEV